MVKAICESSFDINEFSTGLRWAVCNEEKLIPLIAIVLIGQHAHAAKIITELLPAAPHIVFSQLKKEVLINLTVQEASQHPREGYPRTQRDGLIFEIITWIAAKQAAGDRCYLLPPHTSSTTQGLDGLMIELNDSKDNLEKVVFYEDKCTVSPRDLFRDSVIPGFLDRHGNKRSAEIVSATSSLLQQATNDGQVITSILTKLFDNTYRYYQANFALDESFDNEKAQSRLFKGYEQLEELSKKQRIGASLIVEGELRDWFDDLASKVRQYIESLKESIVV